MTTEHPTRTTEEINELKKNWLADPCWDIEDSDGFQAHREELLAWRKEHEAKVEEKVRQWADKRIEKVMFETGIGKADRELLLSLFTFEEIELKVKSALKNDDGQLDLLAAQVRATLLQAAQLKRIADALESMADGDSLSNSVKIWGAGE